MSPAIPNPWFDLGGMPSPRAADVSAPPTPWPSAAIQPQGYPCCPDCGTREPCDEHCPNSPEQTVNAHGANPSGCYAPSADDRDITAAMSITQRFQVDEDTFMAEVEPVPAFLTAWPPSGWPGGCHDPDSCHRHSACMYIQCRYNKARAGLDGAVDEIEALLELARAQDWPVPPVLRRANG